MEYLINDIIDKTDELIKLSAKIKDNCKSDNDLAVFPVLTHNVVLGIEKGLVEKELTEDVVRLKDGIETLSFMAKHSPMEKEEFPFFSDFALDDIEKITNQLKNTESSLLGSYHQNYDDVILQKLEDEK